jgi:hypothetical protein
MRASKTSRSFRSSPSFFNVSTTGEENPLIISLSHNFKPFRFEMEKCKSVPAKTVPEFIAYAKANPGKINMGSSGSGSVSHVFGERFKIMTGINLVHVPYRGG